MVGLDKLGLDLICLAASFDDHHRYLYMYMPSELWCALLYVQADVLRWHLRFAASFFVWSTLCWVCWIIGLFRLRPGFVPSSVFYAFLFPSLQSFLVYSYPSFSRFKIYPSSFGPFSEAPVWGKYIESLVRSSRLGFISTVFTGPFCHSLFTFFWSDHLL